MFKILTKIIVATLKYTRGDQQVDCIEKSIAECHLVNRT